MEFDGPKDRQKLQTKGTEREVRCFCQRFLLKKIQGTNISWEKENHLQKCLGRKYVSFTEGKAPKCFKTHAGMQMFGDEQLQ